MQNENAFRRDADSIARARLIIKFISWAFCVPLAFIAAGAVSTNTKEGTVVSIICLVLVTAGQSLIRTLTLNQKHYTESCLRNDLSPEVPPFCVWQGTLPAIKHIGLLIGIVTAIYWFTFPAMAVLSTTAAELTLLAVMLREQQSDHIELTKLFVEKIKEESAS